MWRSINTFAYMFYFALRRLEQLEKGLKNILEVTCLKTQMIMRYMQAYFMQLLQVLMNLLPRMHHSALQSTNKIQIYQSWSKTFCLSSLLQVHRRWCSDVPSITYSVSGRRNVFTSTSSATGPETVTMGTMKEFTVEVRDNKIIFFIGIHDWTAFPRCTHWFRLWRL